jgi:selenocysteine lyase/cysteine desulfurase
MPLPVVRTILEHIGLESRIGGYEAEQAREDRVQDAYRAVADLLGAQPRNIAFT